MKNFKKIGALLFLSAYLVIGFITPSLAADNMTNDVKFTPQISIPGTEFQQGTGVKVGETIGATTSSTLLARYISSFYTWGLSIVGILAVLMLMAGGITWLTSAGDSGKIGNAKKMISGSLFGTFLLVGAYFFLNTINPGLTKLPALEMANIANVNADKSCDARFKKESCEELLFCQWNGTKCVGKASKCSKDKSIFGSEKVLCCCQTDANGKFNNCNWATYLGGLGNGPSSGPCTACGSAFTNVTDSAEGIGLCAPAPVLDYAADYCKGYWCYQDAAMAKYYYCNPTNKKNGDGCPHDGYCYDKVCWTSDALGNNKAEIGEPCGNETPAGKCYSECPSGYKHELVGGRDCNNSKCCILDSQ